MKISIIISIFFIQKLYCFNQSARQNLKKALFTDYDKTIIPNKLVTILFSFSIRQILSIDEKDQTMVSNIFFYQGWKDMRFTWNISTGSPYEDIKTLTVPASSVWSPDSFILNTVDSTGFFYLDESHLASISYDGWVIINYPLTTLKTRCNIQTRQFPFDTQVCPIALTSWMYQSNQIRFRVTNALRRDQYEENSIWSLVDVNYVVKGDKSRWSLENFYFGEDHEFTIPYIELTLKRKPLYVMANGIFPCLVLNLITLVAYFVHSDIQIELCMTCFLTFSVNLIVISSEIPVQSDYLPVIAVYFLFSIIHSLVSIIWFAFISHCDRTGYLPRWFKWIANKTLKNEVQKLSADEELKKQLYTLNKIVFFVVLIVTILSQLLIWLSVLF